MPEFMKSVWSALRKLPVAKWIKPWWKAALKEAAQRAGDALQKELDEQLLAHGDKALAAAQKKIDGLQERIGKAVDGLPLPADLEAKIKEAINGPVDALQARLSEGCAHGCAIKAQVAFNAAFNKFQGELAARIDAL